MMKKRDTDGSSTIPSGGGANRDEQQPVQEIEPFEPREYTILTHFIGDNDEMHFTSLNNVRTTTGTVQSDQMEVGYYLASCRNRIDKRKQSNCLWRRKSSVLDDDVEQGGTNTVLLENVNSMKLRFLEGPLKSNPNPNGSPTGTQQEPKNLASPITSRLLLRSHLMCRTRAREVVAREQL
jgi:hypothetical protein